MTQVAELPGWEAVGPAPSKVSGQVDQLPGWEPVGPAPATAPLTTPAAAPDNAPSQAAKPGNFDVFARPDGSFVRVDQETHEARPATAQEFQDYQQSWANVRTRQVQAMPAAPAPTATPASTTPPGPSLANPYSEFSDPQSYYAAKGEVYQTALPFGINKHTYRVDPATGRDVEVPASEYEQQGQAYKQWLAWREATRQNQLPQTVSPGERSLIGGIGSGLVRGTGEAVKNVGNYLDLLDATKGAAPPDPGSPNAIVATGQAIAHAVPASESVQKGNLGWRWVSEKGGEMVPTLLGQLGLLAATKGQSATTQLLAFAGPAAVEAAGSTYDSALKRTGDSNLASGEAVVTGIATVGVQRLNLGPLLNNSATKKYFQEQILNHATQIGLKGLAEGSSNAVVSVAQAAGEDALRFAAENDPTAFKDWQKRYTGTALASFGPGAAMGALHALGDNAPAAQGQPTATEGGAPAAASPPPSPAEALGGPLSRPEGQTPPITPSDASGVSGPAQSVTETKNGTARGAQTIPGLVNEAASELAQEKLPGSVMDIPNAQEMTPAEMDKAAKALARVQLHEKWGKGSLAAAQDARQTLADLTTTADLRAKANEPVPAPEPKLPNGEQPGTTLTEQVGKVITPEETAAARQTVAERGVIDTRKGESTNGRPVQERSPAPEVPRTPAAGENGPEGGGGNGQGQPGADSAGTAEAQGREVAAGVSPENENFGPGAARKRDPNFAQQTSISELSDRIAAQQSQKPSILSRMMAGGSIADRLSAGKDVVSTGLAKLRGASAAMYDAFKRPPEKTPYDKLTREWSGADQKSALEIERFKKTAVAQVPDKANRGAIALYMEAGGNPETLAKWANEIAANPKAAEKYGSLFDAATKLTDAQKNIANDTLLHNQATLDEAQKAGILKDGIDNYVMHVWADRPEMQRRLSAESNFNSLVTKPSFTRERTIPTYFDGIMKGMTPKDLDFASLTAAHERSFREAVAARAYIRGLTEAKGTDGRPLVTVSAASAREVPGGGGGADPAYLIKPNLKEGDPYADFRSVDHPALRGWRWATEIDGKPVLVQGDMLVHPEVAANIKNNLGRSAFQNSAVGRAALKVGQEIKSAILSLSAFHQTTLAVHALEHRTSPAGMPDLDMSQPTQAALVDHGLIVAHYDAANQFGEGVASNGLLTKIPIVGPAYHAYTDYLFKDYLPRVKMAMAQHALERNQERYGGTMSQDQILNMTADQANAAFGGLNYRVLGRNKTLQDVLRITLMAPDFLEARGRFAGQALKGHGAEQRVALVLGAAAMYTAARVLNAALNDDHDPHWDKPFALVHDGKEYNLRSIQGDVGNLVADPAAFARNRLSPLLSLGTSVITGVARSGHKESTPAIVGDAIKSNVPIPVQPFTQASSKESTGETIARSLLSMVGIQSKQTNPGDKISRGRPAHLR